MFFISSIPSSLPAEIAISLMLSLISLLLVDKTILFNIVTFLLQEKVSPKRSFLFKIRTNFCKEKSHFEMMNRASSKILSSVEFPSITPKIISASDNFFRDLLIPIFSIVSIVSRIPAVSISLKHVPFILKDSSMVSRVVPGISDTIALSSHNRALSNVLLPLFAAPTIATGMPFLIAFPSLKEDVRRSR